VIATSSPALLASGWTKITPTDTVVPPGRFGHAACWLPTQNALLIYGGVGKEWTSLGDLWAFYPDSLVWRELTPGYSPRARNFPGLCYIESLDKVFVFGGKGGSEQFYNDAWLFDPATMSWESLTVQNTPPPRNAPGCVCDPLGNRVVVFGGSGAGGSFMEDTWIFYPDSNKWQVVIGPHPHERAAGVLSYDPIGYRMILFGGVYANDQDELVKLNDAWCFDLSTLTWDSLEVLNLPPGKFDHGGMFDPTRNRFLTYGGDCAPVDQVWALDMPVLTWYQVETPPPTPGGHARITPLVPDTEFIYGYIFGGGSTVQGTFLQDLWALDLSSPDVPEEIADKGLSLSVSPNPARSQAKIRFTLPGEGPYSLRLYDAAGRMVADLGQAQGPAPTSFVWEPDAGPGVYFLRLEAGGRALTEKLVIQ